MKNDTAKPLRVILLDGKGKPLVGSGCTWETWKHGEAGFYVKGSMTMLRWDQEGVTWKRAEESR